MPSIPLDTIRSIATRYGYGEIQLNQESRVIGFSSMDSNVRINVYYTTGTVATCLNQSPHSGEDSALSP